MKLLTATAFVVAALGAAPLAQAATDTPPGPGLAYPPGPTAVEFPPGPGAPDLPPGPSIMVVF